MPVFAIALGSVLAVVTLAMLVITVVWARRYCRRRKRVADTVNDPAVMFNTSKASHVRDRREDRRQRRPNSGQTGPHDYVNETHSSRTNVSSSLFTNTFETLTLLSLVMGSHTH